LRGETIYADGNPVGQAMGQYIQRPSKGVSQ